MEPYSGTSCADEIGRIQSANLNADARRLLRRWSLGENAQPVRLNRREHGCDGWLGICHFGPAWKDVTGRRSACSIRVKLYRTRALARRADVGINDGGIVLLAS